MKKFYVFLILILVSLGIGFGFYIYRSKTSSPSNNYSSQRLSSSQKENQIDNKANENSKNSDNSNTSQDFKTETQISNFETKIYTKEADRQNNISITCSTLNDTIVNNGDTFSFCDTVGKATTSKGYKEADVFVEGNVVEALGGGNCQVSTTLYNAVCSLDGIEITERHNHSNSVPYISKGQDAAVSYR